MEPKKLTLQRNEMKELEQLFEAISKQPAGPERDNDLKEAQEFADFILSQKEVPIQPLSVEAPLIAAADYLGGATRTTLGEGTLAAKNALQGKPQDPEALSRLGTAFNPLDGELAESGMDINKRLGVEHSDASLADTGAGQTLMRTPLIGEYFGKGRGLDMNADTAKGLPWEMADPAILGAGLKKAMSMIGGKKTATELAQELGEKLATPKTVAGKMGSAIRSTAEAGMNLAMDPGKTIGEALQDFRLRGANAATAERNVEKFSDVYRRHRGATLNPFAGITATGIQQTAEQAVDDIATSKWETLKRLEPTAPRASVGQMTAPLHAPDVREATMTFGDTGPYRSAIGNIEESVDETARARMAQIIRARPGFASFSNAQIEDILKGLPMGSLPVSPIDLENFAKSQQTKAAAARVYAQPGPASVKNMSDLKHAASEAFAEGKLHGSLGMNARDLQTSLIDQADKGAGGEIFRANKDTSSLLTGNPYVARGFDRAGNASSRANNWLSLAQGGARVAGEAIMGVGDVATMAVGNTAASPWARYAAIPAARAEWREGYNEREANDPWKALQRYLPKEGK